jgi:hypothetical protein
MKRISFFLVILCALILSVGLSTAFAQDGIVDLRKVVGLFNGDTVYTGQPIRFVIGYNNNTGLKCDVANGFRAFSPDGTNPDSVTIDSCGPFSGGLGKLANYFSVAYAFIPDASPSGPDSVGFLAAGKGTKPLEQLPVGYNDTVMAVIAWYGASTLTTNDGKHLCIDSSFFGTGGTWLWVDKNLGNHFPTWVNSIPGTPAHVDGSGYCFPMLHVLNQAPKIANTGASCPAGPFVDPSLTGSHCGAFTYNFDACDFEGDPYTFELVSGPGAINASTGVWSASGLATGNYSVVVRAKDAANGPTVSMSLAVTNAAPVIATGCGAIVGGFKNALATTTLTGTDADACDPKNWSIVNVAPAGPVVSIVGGVVNFTSNASGTFTVTVGLSDGIVASPVTCDVQFVISSFTPYGLTIQKVEDAHQGQFYTVDVNATAIDTRYGMGGFDLLISYDNSALSLQGVTTGTVYSQCKWEYFTYRFGANGNCSGGCPSGLVRVVGLAETNNGAAHPVVDCPNGPINLFHMTFLVSNNRTFACSYAPIRWFWIDCGDNTISSTDGSVLAIESSVYDWAGTPGNPYVQIDTMGLSPFAGFPGYYGVDSGLCFDPNLPIGKTNPIRDINFFNGGIDIVCAESIDARGDVNLNGVSYEIADAVMFTNYFIKGLSAFTVNVDGSIAATDVNADGIALSVADLVYLIRVIVGDALAYPKNAVHEANALTTVVTNDNGTLAVANEMGGAFIVVAGNVKPTLLATNMDMNYGFDGQNTRIVVVPSVKNFSGFTGSFINVGGEVVSIDMANLAGESVAAKVTPKAFALNQNYPNPFNPTTTISFALPTAAQYTLTIYNVTGQSVAEFTGAAEAGIVSVNWNASNNASGVYFYKLSAGSFTATKKMVLLK